jgi:hypothetical protein
VSESQEYVFSGALRSCRWCLHIHFFVHSDDGTSSYQKEKAQYENIDDDKFHWNQNIGFDGVSIMPLSCINYNNGHMIKFQLYDSNQSYQCHFAEISTFVVSVAHYMRAYFNYQALVDGQSFALPSDAAYLNCVQLESGNSASVLYGKIGCMERETYTSTKLQLHVYTDAQCSQPYDDGQSSRKHAAKGFIVGNNIISSKISFRPPFYSCLTCSPDQVSESFNKQTENWYDDDYIADNSQKRDQEGDNGSSTAYEDKYYSNKDDVSGDGAAVDDDYYGGRLLTTSKEDLQVHFTHSTMLVIFLSMLSSHPVLLLPLSHTAIRFGTNTNVSSKSARCMTTTTLANGICVSEFINTEYGAMKNADPLTFFVPTNGRLQILLSSQSCALS